MLTRTFVEKILFDEGGMEIRSASSLGCIYFFSVKRPDVTGIISGFELKDRVAQVRLNFSLCSVERALEAIFPALLNFEGIGHGLICNTENEFLEVVRAAKIAIDTLPEKVADPEATEFDPSLDGTEVEAVEKQRRGQVKYRKRLEEYWHNRCAVTGIDVPEVLRASHAKAWIECETGEERLSPFNGLLLCANLDALFDKHLISFDDSGLMLVSKLIPEEQRKLLGIDGVKKIKLEEGHMVFMRWHRGIFKRRSE